MNLVVFLLLAFELQGASIQSNELLFCSFCIFFLMEGLGELVDFFLFFLKGGKLLDS